MTISGRYIYFIGSEEVPLIKIGCTGYPATRLIAFQSGSPVKLKMLCSLLGTEEDEKKLHSKFSNCWSHGEWFHKTEELSDFIRTAAANNKLPRLPKVEFLPYYKYCPDRTLQKAECRDDIAILINDILPPTKHKPPRKRYKGLLKNMAKNSYIFLPLASPESVKSICCRLSAELKRRYLTAKAIGGVDVWRIK